MFEEKETVAPTIIVSQNEMSPPIVTLKPRSYRKYVISAVTGVVMTGIILTAILVGMYLFTESQKDIVKFSYNRDKYTTEEVTSDPNTNIVQYHVTSPSYELLVIDDFNRDIQVMKVQSAGKTNCYVTPLNRTTATDPSKVTVPADSNTMNPNTTYTVTYRAADTPIADTTFLSKTARDECDGISTYWIHPSCKVQNDFEKLSKQSRRKREGNSTGSSGDCKCCHCCHCCHCCSCQSCWSSSCAEY